MLADERRQNSNAPIPRNFNTSAYNSAIPQTNRSNTRLHNLTIDRKNPRLSFKDTTFGGSPRGLIMDKKVMKQRIMSGSLIDTMHADLTAGPESSAFLSLSPRQTRTSRL